MFTITRYDHRRSTYKTSLVIDEEYINDLNAYLAETYDLGEDFISITEEDIRTIMDRTTAFSRYEEKIREFDHDLDLGYVLRELVEDDIWYGNFELVYEDDDGWEDEIIEGGKVKCR